jgi:glycosyltransferase involved in cell wall biosynthesis
MRILLISAAFPPMRAGEATNAFYLCQHLANRKLDIDVLTSQWNPEVFNPRIRVHSIMRSWSWSELGRFVKFLRRSRPDAVLLMYLDWIYHYHPMVTFAPTIFKRVWPGVPFVTRFENAYGALPNRMSPGSRAFRKCMSHWAGTENLDYNFGTLLRDSDRIIVLSGMHRAILSEHFADVSAKSVLIPPPPNMVVKSENDGSVRKRGRERLGVKDDEFLITYLGYIYPTKGLETLLKAFQIVNNERKKARLVLVGGSTEEYSSHGTYENEMHELSTQLGLESKVTWTGEYSWDDGEASVYLRAADICILPFDSGVYLNNSSFSAAAAHGLPIVTTEGSMVEEPLLDQKNVFLCPPKSAKAIADAIKTLMDEPDLRKRLSKGVLKLVRECYSWESAVERTIATFS